VDVVCDGVDWAVGDGDLDGECVDPSLMLGECEEE